MKSLILDVGNSRTKLLAHDPERHATRPWPEVSPFLAELGTWKTPDESEDWSPWLVHLDRTLGEDGILPLILTTVVPDAPETLGQAGLPFHLVGHPGPFPFTLGVQHPETVGADRYCNLAAVCEMGLESAIIVDVGTATTIDVLERGNFPGGLILPGPRTALSGLIQNTSQLPEVPLVAESLKVGTDTREAISRGAWNAALGGIRWCVEGFQAQYGNIPVIGTGGLVSEMAPPEWHLDLHLTLRGAVYLRVLDSVDPS